MADRVCASVLVRRHCVWTEHVRCCSSAVAGAERRFLRIWLCARWGGSDVWGVRHRCDSCVAFRPSGWCFGRGGARRHGSVTVHEVAYSEHSSFDELRDCVRELSPRRIIPTVNCNRGDMARLLI